MVSPIINIILRVVSLVAGVITIGTFVSTVDLQAEKPRNYPTIQSVDYKNSPLQKLPEEKIKEELDLKRKIGKKITTDY